MRKEKSEHKNYIDMEIYLADIKRYRETAETQKMLLDKLVKENEGLKEENKNLRKEVFREEIPRPYSSFINELEEENKKLKEQLERMKTDTMYDMEDINSLYKENQKLKEELSKLKDKYGDIDY